MNKNNNFLNKDLTPLKFNIIKGNYTNSNNYINELTFEENFEEDCKKLILNPNIKLIKNEMFDIINEKILEVEFQNYQKEKSMEVRNLENNFVLENKKKNKVKCTRFLKSKSQLEILENEYIKYNVWDKKKIKDISKLTNLSEYQIYKWNWDKKNNI